MSMSDRSGSSRSSDGADPPVSEETAQSSNPSQLHDGLEQASNVHRASTPEEDSSELVPDPELQTEHIETESEDLSRQEDGTISGQEDPVPEAEGSDMSNVQEETISETSLTHDPEQTVEFSFLSATEAFPEDYQTAYEDPTDEDRDDEAMFTHEATFEFETPQQVDNTPREDEEETNEHCVKIDVASVSGASNEDSKSETEAKIQLIPIAAARSPPPPAPEDDDHIDEEAPDAQQEITREIDDTPSELSVTVPPNKIAVTYQRAQQRMQLILDEQDKQLYMKKNLWTSISLGWKRFKSVFHFSLWSTRIQAVEGKHGSNVGITMYFLRWIVYLNLVISILWLMFTVVPFIAYPPATFSWSIFRENNATELTNGKALGQTWFLYGGYEYHQGATHDGIYEPGIAFPLAACLTLFLSLLSLLNVIGKRIAGEGDSSVIEQNQTYPFSSVVFASWDFHMDDIHSVWNLKNAIRSQIREMLNDAEWSQKTITLKEQLLSGTTKIIGTLVFWPATVCLTAAAMFYAVGNGDFINEYFRFSFAQSFTITLISLAGQFLVRFTVKYEGWHPRVAQQVETTKLFSVKVINLGIILYTIYNIQRKAAAATDLMMESGVQGLDRCTRDDTASCDIGLVCCDEDCTLKFGMEYLGHCVPVCEENEMGMIFYRLVLTNGFILSLQEVMQALVMTYCFGKPPQMDAAKFFVNIVDTQALVWLGSVVAPLLPLFGVLSNVTTFYIKSWLALSIYDPPNTTCSASRNSNMQYNLTLLALLFCALPITSLLYEERDICGPNPGQSMADSLSRRIRKSPSIVKTLIRWVTNPIILGGLLFVLTFFFLLERVRKAKWQKKAIESKNEFVNYRHDMQLKLAETRSRTASPVSVSTFRSQSAFNSPRSPTEGKQPET